MAQSNIFSQTLHSGTKESAYMMNVSGFVKLFLQTSILFFFIWGSWVFNITFDLWTLRVSIYGDFCDGVQKNQILIEKIYIYQKVSFVGSEWSRNCKSKKNLFLMC